MLEELKSEIAHMKAQQQQHLVLAQQAEGAVQALEWVLQKMEPKTGEPSMTMQQLAGAIERAK